MFEIFFEDYKSKVLKKTYRSFRDWKKYEKISLGLVLVASFVVCVASILDDVVTEVIALLFFWGGVGIKLICDNFEKNRKEKQELHIKDSKKRIFSLMGVLNEYGVSADDSDKIKELISVADMKRDEVGLWCVYKECIKKYFIWLTVPVISICVSKYLDIDNANVVIIRAGMVLGIGFALVLVMSAFIDVIRDLKNRNKKDLICLINDLECVLIFKDYKSFSIIRH